MPATNVVLISRHWRESAEFLTRARTSNDRDVIGRTRMSDFTWRAPGPGSEAAKTIFIALLIVGEKERERETRAIKISCDKIARKFDGIVVNARRYCGMKQHAITSCKSCKKCFNTRITLIREFNDS